MDTHQLYAIESRTRELDRGTAAVVPHEPRGVVPWTAESAGRAPVQLRGGYVEPV